MPIIKFHNNSKIAHTVIIEPWAEEYVLQPNTSLTLHVYGKEGRQPYLEVFEEEGATSVYCNDTEAFNAYLCVESRNS